MLPPPACNTDDETKPSNGQTQGRVYVQVAGNIPHPQLLHNTVVRPIPSEINVKDHCVQEAGLDNGWSLTTVAWRALGSLYLWALRMPSDYQEGGVENDASRSNTAPTQSSGQVSDPQATYTAGGTRIWESLGNVNSADIKDGVTKEQEFFDIQANALELLRSTPTSATLPANAVARPGETLIGRVIGNLNTGHIGSNGTSKQTFGAPQASGLQQGFSMYAPQHMRPSTSGFTASGQGNTLGGTPGGVKPRMVGTK